MQMHPESAEMESFDDNFRRSDGDSKVHKSKKHVKPKLKSANRQGSEEDNSEYPFSRERDPQEATRKSRQTEVQMEPQESWWAGSGLLDPKEDKRPRKSAIITYRVGKLNQTNRGHR